MPRMQRQSALTPHADNGTQQLWNPDHGALRWEIILGGTGTSVVRHRSARHDAANGCVADVERVARH